LFKALVAQHTCSIGLLELERPQPVRLSWAGAFVRWLSELGCESAFCLPGRHIDQVLAAIEHASDIRLLTARHEVTAAFMALGAARLTHRPTLVASIGGPGAQLMVAVARSALKDRVPVIFLTGAEDGDDFQSAACDGALYRALGVTSVRINEHTPESALATLAERLRAGDPVHVQIGMNALLADALRPLVVPLAVEPPVQIVAPAPGGILLAAHPGLCRLAPRLRLLAQEYGLCTASTLLARGVFDERAPNHLGHLGFGGGHETLLALSKAPQVLVLDDHWNSCSGQLAALWRNGQAEGWQALRSDSWHLLRQQVCNAPAVLQPHEIRKPCREPEGARQLKALSSDTELRVREYPIRAIRSAPSEPVSALAESARKVFTAVWQNLPPQHCLFVDAGELRRAACELTMVDDAADLLLCEREAPMGFALSASIGASFAQAERAIVALMGDGSFLMHAGELATAAAARLPLVFVVHQNGSLGAPAERARGQSWSKHCLLPEFDSTALAQSLGVEAELLSSPVSLGSALRSALRWTQRNARPYLIAVRWRQS